MWEKHVSVVKWATANQQGKKKENAVLVHLETHVVSIGEPIRGLFNTRLRVWIGSLLC